MLHTQIIYLGKNKARRFLKNNKGIILLPEDKGNSIVVMNIVGYVYATVSS